MSLDDLAIKQHTAPILAELDRQKEKCAAMRRERDALRVRIATLETETVPELCRDIDTLLEADALRVERNVTARELTAEVERLKAERDALLAAASGTAHAAMSLELSRLAEEVERLREALQEIESLSEPGSIVCEIIRAARCPRKAPKVKR